MTCLELMKKLRPDLSEENIINRCCPDIPTIHMRKPIYGCRTVSCPTGCVECWNQEVDEDMLYFQDEVVEEHKPDISDEVKLQQNLTKLKFGSDFAIEHIYKQKHELDITKDELIKSVEKIKTLERENKDMNDNFNSAMELVSKRDREIAELKEKVKELEKNNSILIDKRDRAKDDRDIWYKSCENYAQFVTELREKNKELKEKNEKLKKEAEKIKKSGNWKTNDGC